VTRAISGLVDLEAAPEVESLLPPPIRHAGCHLWAVHIALLDAVRELGLPLERSMTWPASTTSTLSAAWNRSGARSRDVPSKHNEVSPNRDTPRPAWAPTTPARQPTSG